MNFKERASASTTVKTLQTSVPSVIISKIALTKMKLFVDKCADEIGWLGTAIREDKLVYIDDVYLFDQEVHSTTTEITPEGLSDFAVEVLEMPNGMEVWNNLRVWGHSHVQMGVSPSLQDDNQMETFKEGGHPWFIRIIANKKGELKIDMYDYEHSLIYLDLPWEGVESEEEEAIHDKIALLYEELDKYQDDFVKIFDEEITDDMKLKVRKKAWGAKNSNWSNKSEAGFTKNTEVGGTKKKEKEEEEDDNQTVSWLNSIGEDGIEEDYYDTDHQVLRDFDTAELLNLSLCTSMGQLREALEELGWFGMFTPDDLLRIWKIADQEYLNYGGLY